MMYSMIGNYGRCAQMIGARSVAHMRTVPAPSACVRVGERAVGGRANVRAFAAVRACGRML